MNINYRQLPEVQAELTDLEEMRAATDLTCYASWRLTSPIKVSCSICQKTGNSSSVSWVTGLM